MELYITITGSQHHYGLKAFKVGRILKLTKEYDNLNDESAICVDLPYLGKVGYVANSAKTVYSGTESAGRLYEKIGDRAYAKIKFVTHSSAIAKVITEEEALHELGEYGKASPEIFFDKPSHGKDDEQKRRFLLNMFTDKNL